jgi:hypothetical protein
MKHVDKIEKFTNYFRIGTPIGDFLGIITSHPLFWTLVLRSGSSENNTALT